LRSNYFDDLATPPESGEGIFISLPPPNEFGGYAQNTPLEYISRMKNSTPEWVAEILITVH